MSNSFPVIWLFMARRFKHEAVNVSIMINELFVDRLQTDFPFTSCLSIICSGFKRNQNPLSLQWTRLTGVAFHKTKHQTLAGCEAQRQPTQTTLTAPNGHIKAIRFTMHPKDFLPIKIRLAPFSIMFKRAP
ncbi:hypothetical protein X726_06300 [Mesorhizobium sp. L103C105A0]|nr:hypothetical protein X726_06300 [Mesorhizobium sp. L103C105A0]